MNGTTQWVPTPTIEWLLLDGWKLRSTNDLIRELAERLVMDGVDLDRMFLLVPTLHPQYAGRAHIWRRDTGEVIEAYGNHGVFQTPEYRDNPLPLVIDHGYEAVRRRLDASYARGEFPLLDEFQDTGITDYIAMSLEYADGARTALSTTTRRPGGFQQSELAQFWALRPVLARLIEHDTLRTTTRNLLTTYIGQDAGHRVLSGQVTRSSGEWMRAVLWYCDLRGSTLLSESLPADAFIETLNSYFEAMADPVHAHGGQVLKFIGDAMLAIFPIREDSACPDTCCRALEAAMDAMGKLEELNQRRTAEGLGILQHGLALHMGDVIYGNVGAADRLDFTVIGRAVNEVVRLQDLCKSLKRAPLMSSAFAGLCARPTESVGRFRLRGLSDPLDVFAPAAGKIRSAEPMGDGELLAPLATSTGRS